MGGRNARSHREWFRRLLGYVSQNEVVHTDLSGAASRQIQAQLREQPEANERVALEQVDLSDDGGKQQRPIRQLSGGEAKRVRIAAELVTCPCLLVLDEPGSGLDRDREAALMHLLRSLSHRGCTVIVVTHNPDSVRECDRVLSFQRGGRLDGDRTPRNSHDQIPARELAPQDTASIRYPVAPTESCDDRTDSTAALSQWQAWHQLSTLISRECSLLQKSPWRRFVLPVAIVPAVFATAIGVTVEPDRLPLLGFLCTLSCIWMGASLSLLAIANERLIYEHEKLLFLRVSSYVGAKTMTLWVLSSGQTLVFFFLLWAVRRNVSSHDSMLLAPYWSLVCLWLVSLAATGIGLVISALVGTSTFAANFILPFVMMAQMVFSVHIAGRADHQLQDSYGDFTVHYCCASPDCRRRAQMWIHSGGTGFQWKCAACASERDGRLRHPNAKEDARENADRPNYLAVLASYLTVSRYGDIALRSFAYDRPAYQAFVGPAVEGSGTTNEPAQRTNYGYPRWRHEAMTMLVLMVVGFPGLAGMILWYQPIRMKDDIA